MTFTEPDFLSTNCFIVLCLAIVLVFLRSVYKIDKKILHVAFPLFLWLGLFSNAVYLGLISPNIPKNIIMAFTASNLVALMIGFSPVGRRLSKNLTIKSLIAFQMFRLPLELILHYWVKQGTIPQTMTWTGYNFDIITGIIAVTGYFLVDRHRWVAWYVNIIGFSLLVNVARVAMLSSPLSFAWNVNPPLQLLFHLPYALIVPICVAGALAGHIILTRALLRRSSFKEI